MAKEKQVKKEHAKNEQGLHNKKDSTAWKNYSFPIFVASVILVVGYLIIYACFVGDGFIPTGLNLEKRDWLSFLGTYLTFAGASLISIVAILQSVFYAKQEKNRQRTERKKRLQPIFSIDISAIDSQILGTAEAVGWDIPKHKNVTLDIENVSDYAIRNVIVFDKFVKQLLKPNEKLQIQVAYSDSPDIKQWKKHLIELCENDYNRTEEGIPTWFNINYEDIDGNDMFQTFELKEFDCTPYFSLKGIYDV